MRLPSGHEINRASLLMMFEAVVAEKFMMEETFEGAFEPMAESLREGQYTDIPALGDEDIHFLYTTLANVVIVCETKLRATLGKFEADNPVISSW